MIPLTLLYNRNVRVYNLRLLLLADVAFMTDFGFTGSLGSELPGGYVGVTKSPLMPTFLWGIVICIHHILALFRWPVRGLAVIDLAVVFLEIGEMIIVVSLAFVMGFRFLFSYDPRLLGYSFYSSPYFQIFAVIGIVTLTTSAAFRISTIIQTRESTSPCKHLFSRAHCNDTCLNDITVYGVLYNWPFIDPEWHPYTPNIRPGTPNLHSEILRSDRMVTYTKHVHFYTDLTRNERGVDHPYLVHPIPAPVLPGSRLFGLLTWKARLLHGSYSDVPDTSHTAGVSDLGGFWAFVDGAFTLFFGANVVYFALGHRPLSALGLAHLFQRRALVRRWHEDFPTIHTEGGLPGSELAGIVAFIRERLVDVDEEPRATEDDQEHREAAGLHVYQQYNHCPPRSLSHSHLHLHQQTLGPLRSATYRL
ncbi:hypothetical protein B0H13DRAFT_2283577 [Mycena leptocephala]|nr:hypothetical protein B0H13DRAFT_2283577 [Mycena leptocephala]